MKNSYLPNDYTPDPEEQGWLSPPGRKPPTAMGTATPPPDPRDPRGNEYAALRSRRARRLRTLGFMLAATILAVSLGTFPLLALFVAAPLAAEGLYRARGMVSRLARGRVTLYAPR